MNIMPASLDLERLYDEHAQALCLPHQCHRNESDTRDLLQELFVKLARRSELLDGVSNERPSSSASLHNAAIDRRGVGTRGREPASDSPQNPTPSSLHPMIRTSRRSVWR
jgi:DNA-directed RNA polymerase specialized sigma24 family protein